jgi:hypothetical protein
MQPAAHIAKELEWDYVDDCCHKEETERGGYFCSYPVFRGIYQASIRIMKRTRVPVYLMLCTLEDEEDRQVQSETKINKYSRQLKKCVGESIRYSDIYTSYGKVQFLIMLIGLKREDCEIVKKRINRHWFNNCKCYFLI